MRSNSPRYHLNWHSMFGSVQTPADHFAIVTHLFVWLDPVLSVVYIVRARYMVSMVSEFRSHVHWNAITYGYRHNLNSEVFRLHLYGIDNNNTIC